MRAVARYAALLRAVNVGGRKLPMADLRTALGEAGFEDVATYVQSGNVVLRSEAGAAAVEGRMERLIADSFGLETRVLVRTHDELEAVAAANPYPEVTEGRRLHVVFLDGAPDAAAVDRIDPERSPGDRYAVVGRELYLHLPDGAGRTKLTLDYLERRLGVAGTARNWNTVLKLVELTGG